MQVGEKATPVRQIGEGVEIGEAGVLFGEAERLPMFLGEFRLKIDHGGEIARMGEQNVDHRRGHQREVDAHRDVGWPSSRNEKRRGRRGADEGHDEGGRPDLHQAENAADDGDRQEES